MSAKPLFLEGMPLDRVHVSVTTLDPSVSALGYTWRSSATLTGDSYAHGGFDKPVWRSNPFSHMMETGLNSMRVRLDRPRPTADFPIFAQFRRDGLTDWLALRQTFDWAAPRTPYG